MWDQTESLSGNEDSNDQENLLLTRNSSKSRPNQVKTYWNDECGENGSTKENLFQKPIICSCCRKRNEQCNVGDTLDIVPSKEHNEITQKNEFSKLEQVERYGTFCARKLIIVCVTRVFNSKGYWQSQGKNYGKTYYDCIEKMEFKLNSSI